jgi:hypothetical protein
VLDYGYAAYVIWDEATGRFHTSMSVLRTAPKVRGRPDLPIPKEVTALLVKIRSHPNHYDDKLVARSTVGGLDLQLVA